MTMLDETTVIKTCKLARLAVPDAEKLAALTQDLNNILGMFEELRGVDTDGVEPLASISGISERRRDDIVCDGGTVEAILKNAPEAAEGFFVTQKIVE